MTEATKRKRANAMLGLLAQTSIHAGSGINTGVIDLSIQREGHNGWPCIFGSAVKGAMRAHAEDNQSKENEQPGSKGQGIRPEEIELVFGAGANKDEANAGAVAFGDARLLLFPVRSLTSQFKWVTCPAALQRYKNDAERMGLQIDYTLATVPLTEELALVAETAAGDRLFLEEYRFNTQQQNLDQIINILSELMPSKDAENLRRQLVIVSDDMFSFMVQHATPVNAHNALDPETKTTKPGALWYEETLPPETLLYFTLSAAAARKREVSHTAEAMRTAVTGFFPEGNAWLQLGGNETVGMGWCAIRIKQEIKE